jgi:phage protein D/phage baseplate assembly protein gpV
MADPIASLTSQIYIKINGTMAAEDVMANLAEVVVDQHVHLPDMFTIRLHDASLNFVDGGPFDLTASVEVGSFDAGGEPISLIEGEITTLKPNFNARMVAELVVRGYDRSHRLYREKRSRAYLNVKDSDLAQEIAARANLHVETDPTAVIYDHVYQNNRSDLAFLMERAWRIGYECFVEKETLYFRKPPMNGQASTVLTWGEDLLSVQPQMSLSEQVNEVVVKGWDFEKQQPIVGQAENGRLYPDIKEDRDGAAWSSNFGHGRLVITDQPVTSQTEADLLASARMDEISGAFVEVEGSVFRRPDVKAGRMVALEGLGNRFSGSYLVTGATHVYRPTTGLETHFAVRGLRDGSLTEQVMGQPHASRWFGVVPAVVTNNDDPESWGRVKVTYPWMSEKAESDWARGVSLGAGPQSGFFALPDVGDEVLVAFEHGDFGRPFVLGSLWNGKSGVPPETAEAGSGQKSSVRSWRSRAGHRITMRDDSQKIEVETSAGQSLTLDDGQGKIEIASGSGLTVTLDERTGKIAIESTGNVEINASGNMKLEAGANMDIQARGQVNVRGATINLN